MKDVYNYSIVGFEFEFFCRKGINYVKKELSKVLSKKILIFEEVHGDFIPTDDIFKLEKDYSGGDEMIELITGPIKYTESRLILIKVLNWIKRDESCYTNNKCSMQYNISFDTKYTGTSFLTHINILKFILELDEDSILEKFPKRKDSVYSKSIKFIVPLDKFYIENIKLTELAPKNFILPYEKYYGVNFSKLVQGYLEFRYLGGKGYEGKLDDTQLVIDYCIETLYETLRNSSFTKRNLEEIKRILSKHRRIIESYKSHANFKSSYPKIKLSVDLNHDDKVIDVYFNTFKDKIFDILSLANMKTGYINYDTDKSKLQLKNTTLNNCYFLDNVDIVESTINGTLLNSKIVDSKIKNSSLENCEVFGESNIEMSKVKNGYISTYCTVKNSYLFGRNLIFNGNMTGGIFREGKISTSANIASDVSVVDFKKI
jgi:hypothetical protein